VKNGPSLGGYGAAAMNAALTVSTTRLPGQLRRSLTWDRGKELSGHAQFALETGTRVFLAADEPQSRTTRTLAEFAAACPHMTQPTTGIRGFAPLSRPHVDNADALTRWIAQVRAAQLPPLHAFTRGPERDRGAVIAGLHRRM